MPMFSTPHHLKTYSRNKTKQSPAIKAFDDVILRDEKTSAQSDDLSDRDQRLKRKSDDEKEKSVDGLFSFSSDEDTCSKPKRQKFASVKSRTKEKPEKTAAGLAKKTSVDVKKKLPSDCAALSSEVETRRKTVLCSSQGGNREKTNVDDGHVVSTQLQRRTRQCSGKRVIVCKAQDADASHESRPRTNHANEENAKIAAKRDEFPDDSMLCQNGGVAKDMLNADCAKFHKRNTSGEQIPGTVEVMTATDCKAEVLLATLEGNAQMKALVSKTISEVDVQAKAFVDRFSRMFASKSKKYSNTTSAIVTGKLQENKVIPAVVESLDDKGKNLLHSNDAILGRKKLILADCSVDSIPQPAKDCSLDSGNHSSLGENFLSSPVLHEHRYVSSFNSEETVKDNHSCSLLSNSLKLFDDEDESNLLRKDAQHSELQPGRTAAGRSKTDADVIFAELDNSFSQDPAENSEKLSTSSDASSLNSAAESDENCSVVLLSPMPETPDTAALPTLATKTLERNISPVNNSPLHSYNTRKARNQNSDEVPIVCNSKDGKSSKLQKDEMTQGLIKSRRKLEDEFVHRTNDRNTAENVRQSDFDKTKDSVKSSDHRGEFSGKDCPGGNKIETPTAKGKLENAVKNEGEKDHKNLEKNKEQMSYSRLRIRKHEGIAKDQTNERDVGKTNDDDLVKDKPKQNTAKQNGINQIEKLSGDCEVSLNGDTQQCLTDAVKTEVKENTKGNSDTQTKSRYLSRRTRLELAQTEESLNSTVKGEGNQNLVGVSEKLKKIDAKHCNNTGNAIEVDVVLKKPKSEKSQHLAEMSCVESVLKRGEDSVERTPVPVVPQKSESLSQCWSRPSVRRLFKSPYKAANKAKAVYNPRQWHEADDEKDCAESTKGHLTKSASALESYNFSDFDDPPPVLTRVSTWPKHQDDDIMKLRVAREEKPLFTVVRNVKEAHECQEYGETQEFRDDVDYILDGLQCSQPLATRCLSTLSLASKCMVPAFRMHLRAHGVTSKIFEALHDASEFRTLSLCLSAMLFTMSCDRLVSELDDFSLRLILRLLDVHPQGNDTCDAGSSDQEEFERIQQKVLDICLATIRSNKITHVNFKLRDMTSQFLGMEILLSVTSKQMADSLKRSMRSLGGLQHIVEAADQCVEEIEKLTTLQLLSDHRQLCIRAEKYLKVLDNLTYLCPENQSFLIDYKSAACIKLINRLLVICVRMLTSDESSMHGKSVDEEKKSKDSPLLLLSTCLLSLLRLLLNITHENDDGSLVTGQQENLMSSVLTAVLTGSDSVPPSQQFDLSILGLSLLINLAENCEANRQRLIRLRVPAPSHGSVKNVSVPDALGLLFSSRYHAARLIEELHDAKIEAVEKELKSSEDDRDSLTSASESTAHHRLSSSLVDQSGQWVECESGLQWIAKEEEEDSPVQQRCKATLNHCEADDSPRDDVDNYMKDLHTAGRHMEDSIVAAYVALLIGAIVQHNMNLAEKFRSSLPEFSFNPLVRMLQKFLGFMNFTNLTNSSGSKSFHRILEVLESC